MLFVNPPEKAPQGVTHHRFFSRLAAQDVGYNIYQPPGYADSDEKLPVLYFLHGIGGHESSDIGISGLLHRRLIADAPDAPVIKPMLMVFVNGFNNSWYQDAADGSLPAESIIIRELIPHIDETYRTIADRESRFLEGFSMGGGGAFYFAMKYPDLFGSVVAYAGAFRDKPAVQPDDGSTPPLLKVSADTQTPYYWLEQNIDAIRNRLRIRMVVGSKDFLFERNEKMHAKLDALAIAHEYIIMPDVDHNLGVLIGKHGEAGLAFH